MRKLRITSLFARSVAVACCVSMVNLAVPMGIAGFIKQSLPTPPLVKPLRDQQKPKAAPRSRILSGAEMRKAQGKYSTNPYLAGSAKWDPSYKGVDLITRNFSASATDLSFEGGYGIPVNVTRSYSANNGEEGPFGVGWSLSADVRTTAGGLLKSSGAPIRTVPNSFKERHSAETSDPNIPSTQQPTEAVTACDASGKDETMQEDVDGIITAPAWDTNLVDNTYETITFNGSEWQLLVSSKVTTVEGTVYQYAKEGYYCDPNNPSQRGAQTPFDQPTATGEPSNVLKIVSATDRQGNETDYTYGSAQVEFTKVNGTTMENQVTGVAMPNGHTIAFTWGNGSTTGTHPGPIERIVSINDNSAVRTVAYTYSGTTTDGSGVIHGGMLASMTSPGGLTTQYGYSTATAGSNGVLSTGNASVLTSITDPRGLTTTIDYLMDNTTPAPYSMVCYGPCVWRIIAPNGIYTYFDTHTSNRPSAFGDEYYPSTANVIERAGGPHGTLLSDFGCFSADNTDGTCTTTMRNYLEMPDPSMNHYYVWEKTYDEATQNLLTDKEETYPIAGTRYKSLASDRFTGFGYWDQPFTYTTATTTYNFMGNPLNKSVSEVIEASGSWPTYATKETQYAYWGSDKYYQQKSVRTRTGPNSTDWRYSFADYFDNTASAGSKGQTRYVYDPKNGGIYLDGTASVPSGTPSGEEWRYQVTAPSSGHSYSASFVYDAKGRPTDVYKLQSTSGSSWSYVRTSTTYGADTDGSWGQASEVVEDSGGYNRTTQTLHYTTWGVADKVEDAVGHIFETNYDLDGKVQWAKREDVTPNVTVVSYSYYGGSESNQARRYQPYQITDGLSSVTQTIDYTASGAGLGQPSSVTETRGSNTYTTAYTYGDEGQRQYVTETTPNGSTQWWYHDYIQVGAPESPSYAFQTLTKMTPSGSSWNVSSEEMHYAYDSRGRVRVAAFGLTPQPGYTPSSGDSYYDSSHVPTSRARAVYLYDAAGRTLGLNHYWDYPVTGGGYQTDYLLGNTCAYTDYLGLKNSSTFLIQSSSNSHSSATDTIGGSAHVEAYGYDADLDYLTSAQYVTSGTTTTWSYDAAGNRNDASVVDNLNRATTIGGVSRTYDILGNTTAIGTKTMSWDCLNRMSQYNNGANSIANTYRADGMRVRKANQLTPSVYTDYAYDGQMPVEEFNYRNSYPFLTAIKLIRYGLGARGVDWIERTSANNAVTTGYPIYDAQGNMVATLGKTGADAYTIADQRNYDAWGGILAGNASGEPNGRYGAGLGHLQDDESGFVYMRARFYDPTCGRFVSEDERRDFTNYYVYAWNCPTRYVDVSGEGGDLWGSIGELFDKLLKLCNAGGSAAAKIKKLQVLMKEFEKYINWNDLISGEQMTEGEAAAETAPFAGTFSDLQMRIADIKMSWAEFGFAKSGVMRLTMAGIKALIELLEDS